MSKLNFVNEMLDAMRDKVMHKCRASLLPPPHEQKTDLESRIILSSLLAIARLDSNLTAK